MAEQVGLPTVRKNHHDLAVSTLQDWANVRLRSIPGVQESLAELQDPMIDSIAGAYDDLRSRVAGQKLSGEANVAVRFGPTGAAKILYALRPASLPPWDDAIREYFDWDGSGESYGMFLRRVKSEITELVSDAGQFGITPQELPSRVGRPNASLPKLVDEYYWITITRGFEIPSRAVLTQWVTWCGSPDESTTD